MLTVVCVLKNGGKANFNSNWVTKMKNMVERNLTIPHNFVCLSDVEVECERIPLTHNLEGFWSKLELFKMPVDGPVLYIDLDTVICQNIDIIVERLAGNNFVMWHDTYRNIHSSALMYWEGDYSFLWDKFISQPLTTWQAMYGKGQKYYGDQGFIYENVDHTLTTAHCPGEWFHLTAKSNRINDMSKVKMFMFQKKYKQPYLKNHPVVRNHWH